MAFNHYAKIKRILAAETDDWYIKLINQPTTAQNFKGEMVHYDHYYRVCRPDGSPIPYCKFQKLDKLAQVLGVEVASLPVIEED